MNKKPRDDHDLRSVLNQRMAENYNAFLEEWERMDTAALISKSDEIAATRKCFWGLKAIPMDKDALEYLLRFQNPLEVVRDRHLIRTDEDTNPFFREQELPNTIESLFYAELDEYPLMDEAGISQDEMRLS